MSAPRTDATRSAILKAAMAEFAREGEAGARTEAIAKAAGLNKALIHYYFGTKEGLYGAVLDEVFTGLVESFLRNLQGPGTPGERLLRHFLAHFDHLASAGAFTRLLGHEMMRARSGQATRISRIVDIAFRPLHAALAAVLDEGARSGELRPLDPEPVLVSLTGANTFYFISAPIYREITGEDPRDPARLARQREALLDFAASILFSEPSQGRLAAARILSEPRGEQP
ncbi:TetR/AcrR family transcriptional regulator [Geothrix sp. 21YS21S-2]|uniref:TetR/AcrR family transcriptional regulator n=1 Tax=Geothrix sp. 21YS21S-2 TaxID=3068893 RepID=UPI0027B8CF03|nr:TetR/AcrR family transcriptional regulator [Geothrix sp. 21YS21S-2]